MRGQKDSVSTHVFDTKVSGLLSEAKQGMLTLIDPWGIRDDP